MKKLLTGVNIALVVSWVLLAASVCLRFWAGTVAEPQVIASEIDTSTLFSALRWSACLGLAGIVIALFLIRKRTVAVCLAMFLYVTLTMILKSAGQNV